MAATKPMPAAVESLLALLKTNPETQASVERNRASHEYLVHSVAASNMEGGEVLDVVFTFSKDGTLKEVRSCCYACMSRDNERVRKD